MLKYWQKQEIGENRGEIQIWVQDTSDLKKNKFLQKHSNISEYEVVPKSAWVRTQKFDVASEPPRQNFEIAP